MREFEDRFINLGIPYRVVGGPRFYERAEIRDANAYLRLVAQPDDDLAFERIVNKPRRGMGDVAVQTIHKLARAENTSLYRASKMLVASEELKPAARRALAGAGGGVGWRDPWPRTVAGTRGDHPLPSPAIPRCGRTTNRRTRPASSKT